MNGAVIGRSLRWLVPLAGLVVGVLTSFAQGWLDAPWSALANAASPWLAVAWLAGWCQRGVGAAAVAGALTCVGEVVGYYGASAARDLGVSTHFVLFWLVCGLLGGPAFGACGRLARSRGMGIAGVVGACALAATFLGEGIGAYGIRLGYGDVALLFVGIGLVAGLVALAAMRRRGWQGLAVILLGTVAGAVVYGPLLGVLG